MNLYRAWPRGPLGYAASSRCKRKYTTDEGHEREARATLAILPLFNISAAKIAETPSVFAQDGRTACGMPIFFCFRVISKIGSQMLNVSLRRAHIYPESDAPLARGEQLNNKKGGKKAKKKKKNTPSNNGKRACESVL